MVFEAVLLISYYLLSRWDEVTSHLCQLFKGCPIASLLSITWVL